MHNQLLGWQELFNTKHVCRLHMWNNRLGPTYLSLEEADEGDDDTKNSDSFHSKKVKRSDFFQQFVAAYKFLLEKKLSYLDFFL